MARRYFDELLELKDTYEAILALPDSHFTDIKRAQRELNQRPAIFVGSGGALALAQLAAGIHAQASVHPERAGTPLGLALGKTAGASGSAIGLFSARARHPDVRLAAKAARTQPGNWVLLLTQLDADAVDPRLRHVVDEVVTLPRTTGDGFLATNSLLAMGGSWIRAAGIDLPPMLPHLGTEVATWPQGATRVLVLHSPDQTPAAVDLEARLSETGLLDVQLADLRNMAHGRHVGLLQRAESTVVVTIADPASRELLGRTMDALGSVVKTIDLSTQLSGTLGSLDTMVASMKLVGVIAQSQTVDPGKPRVSATGRRLYHLPLGRLATATRHDRPSRMKAQAAGMSDLGDGSHWYERWLHWLEEVNGRKVNGVVLDYDGTCVATRVRTFPPSEEVERQVLRLLDAGVRLGFASGRGPSVIKELRRWLPRSTWGSVAVGLYNGGVVQPLSVDVEGATPAHGDLAAAESLLRARLVGGGWELTPRRWQLTLERSGTNVADAAAFASAVLQPEFASTLKVVKSGHSVDIVPANTTKLSVLENLDLEATSTLCVGDQGDVMGNDFELLSCSPLTLSVDLVSPDPTRCWNLSVAGDSGPDLLARYLSAVVVGAAGASFRWTVGGRT